MNILASLRLIYIVAIKFPHVDGKKFSIIHDKCGMSPIMGVVLMVLLAIVLAGITVSAVYSDEMLSSMKPAPVADIDVNYVKGGVPDGVRFEYNFICLQHMGGASLELDSTMIVISGEGSSYTGGFVHGSKLYGNTVINYENLMFDGKIKKYASRNQDLLDGMWSAGETIILNGDDSINGTSASSVSVCTNGITNTSNNYGLKENEVVSIKIFDKETQRIIAESECQVALAE